MRILGIDPGTRMAGYGIIEIQNSGKILAVAAGAWDLNANQELASRLATLAIEFRRVVAAYAPTHLCIELSFLAENPRSALYLGHARGVVLSEAHQSGLKISEISATSAKKIISGNGRCNKNEIAKIMSSLLGFQMQSLPLDATDALSIACADAMRIKQSSFHSSSIIDKSDSNKKILEEWSKSKKQKRRLQFF
ncbi:crossover junction endodeoxyribonuclease RuvC [Pigmentibacter ruber]|uniref:crossover junction endodeoxyribonuclease RuvC n=1 Tax=Pigmentibacter ruber TaxID=2683196 RepID=UPI00131B0515|nr:crossover junction endodeoxyribonuclease RuvC [Pigmentibacter ruber]BFD31814.1 crossover junction endodeoxyribonuclease RuvC [Pigmentibacter ruber]